MARFDCLIANAKRRFETFILLIWIEGWRKTCLLHFYDNYQCQSNYAIKAAKTDKRFLQGVSFLGV